MSPDQLAWVYHTEPRKTLLSWLNQAICDQLGVQAAIVRVDGLEVPLIRPFQAVEAQTTAI